MVCAFFGHRYCSDKVIPLLNDAIIEMIENRSVDKFYFGNHGEFDRTVKTVLKKIKKDYPHIKIYEVLAYIPIKKDGFYDSCETILPDGIEFVPGKYAILHRNKWMAQQCDYVICYVLCSAGGAAQSVEYAKKMNKFIINLGQDIQNDKF